MNKCFPRISTLHQPHPSNHCSHSFIFLYVLCLCAYIYIYIYQSPLHPPSEYYLITLKRLFFPFSFTFPWQASKGNHTWNLAEQFSNEDGKLGALSRRNMLSSHESYSLSRAITHGFFPVLRHQISFIILKVSVPLLNLIDMGNGFKISKQKE